MDEVELNNLIQKCEKLKFKFVGVFAANNFRLPLPLNKFIIANASKEKSLGSHWLLLYNYNGLYVFADPLGYPLASYKFIYENLCKSQKVSTVFEINKLQPIQNPSSTSCGLFCVYIAHVINSSNYQLPMTINLLNETDLARFAKHML